MERCWFLLDARSETHIGNGRWVRLQRQEATRANKVERFLWQPGSETVGKGFRDGADGLDEQETQQYRSLVGTALYFGQDRPETQNATKEEARFNV